jgi:plastocyanin
VISEHEEREEIPMRRPLNATVASTVLLLAACSSGGGGATPSPSASESPEAAATVNVSATEYAFDVPSEVQGGVVTMTFANVGGLPHEFALARIEEGKTEADVAAVVESPQEPPDWMQDVAGVPGLSPGESVTVTRTLEPGTYVFLCFFPDPEGTPHASLGMHEVFTIAGDTGAALPEPDATITATDAGLQVPTFSPGEQTVEFENGGTEPHELFLAAFASGKGVDDVDRWFESGFQGEPPATFLGGMQTIPAGESVFLTIDLESGVEYTALDFSTESIETFTAS